MIRDEAQYQYRYKDEEKYGTRAERVVFYLLVACAVWHLVNFVVMWMD